MSLRLSDNSIRKISILAFGLSGFTALLYEVVWFRALSLVLGSTTYALSTMLATFMAGLSIGAYAGGRWADRAGNPVLLFAYMEGGIAVLALLVFPLINHIPPLYAWLFYTFRFSFAVFSASQFFLCSLILLLPTVLMGATFPVVCRIYHRGDGIGREMGAVYAVNTVGAIAGSIAAGFLLIPGMGLWTTNTAGALLNLFTAVTLIIAGKGGPRIVLALLIPLLSTLFMGGLLREGEAYPFNYYMGYRFASYGGFKKSFGFADLLYDKDSAEGNARVVRMVGGSKALINNGKIESSNTEDLLNLAALSYLPISANTEAEKFLNIGHGTGGTVFYASRIPSLKEIYSVEINPSVLEASRLFFYPDIFSNPKIRFITGDARNYLGMVDEKYDIITSEPSYPVDRGFSNLYSREFFEIVRSRLNEGGVFCQWVPRYIFKGEEFRMITSTFRTVFPVVTIWKAKGSDFLLLGGKAADFNVAEVLFRVRSMLKEAGLPPEDFELLSDQADVERHLRDYKGDINTDDRPLVEFIGARRMVGLNEAIR